MNYYLLIPIIDFPSPFLVKNYRVSLIQIFHSCTGPAFRLPFLLMVRILYSPADSSLPDSRRGEDILSHLPGATRTRIRALRNKGDASRSLTAYSLLFQFLSASFDASPKDLVFVEGPHGKPELKTPDGICFNCAHSGKWALCAVSRYPVGVDIEEISFPFDDSLYAYLHPTEIEYLDGFPGDLRDEKFLDIWTTKEAYLKALGCGLLRDPASFAIVCSGQGKLRVEDSCSPPGITPRLMQKHDIPGCAAAACLLVPGSGRGL